MEQAVRLATERDAASVLAIYAPIVSATAISFEEAPPTQEDIAARIRETVKQTPWLVCERGEAFQGYAYAGKFRARPAYQWTAEVTVYVSPEHQGQGVASRLYRSLFDALTLQGFRTAVAGIALPNPASVALHERFGFEEVGVFPKVGYKLGRWHDVGWWRKPLGDYEPAPYPPRPLGEIVGTDAWERLLAGRP